MEGGTKKIDTFTMFTRLRIYGLLRAVPLKNPRTGKTPSLKFDPPGSEF